MPKLSKLTFAFMYRLLIYPLFVRSTLRTCGEYTSNIKSFDITLGKMLLGAKKLYFICAISITKKSMMFQQNSFVSQAQNSVTLCATTHSCSGRSIRVVRQIQREEKTFLLNLFRNFCCFNTSFQTI